MTKPEFAEIYKKLLVRFGMPRGYTAGKEKDYPYLPTIKEHMNEFYEVLGKEIAPDEFWEVLGRWEQNQEPGRQIGFPTIASLKAIQRSLTTKVYAPEQPSDQEEFKRLLTQATETIDSMETDRRQRVTAYIKGKAEDHLKSAPFLGDIPLVRQALYNAETVKWFRLKLQKGGSSY